MTATRFDVGNDHPASGLLRSITDDERTAYARDGAAIIKDVIPREWIEYMREALTRVLNNPSLPSLDYAGGSGPRFFSMYFAWMFDDAFKAWAAHGPLPEIARAVLPDAEEIIFIYDQIFSKEPGDKSSTPWHQDYPFLPIEGDQQLRIWVPFDVVTKDTGALHYLPGSHKWNRRLYPAFAPPKDADPTYELMPDFYAEYDQYEWLVAEAEPGDILLHHPYTIHGTYPNVTDRFRRAIANYYVGDKAIWNPDAANLGSFMEDESVARYVTPPDLSPGGSIACDMFPRVWPQPISGGRTRGAWDRDRRRPPT